MEWVLLFIVCLFGFVHELRKLMAKWREQNIAEYQRSIKYMEGEIKKIEQHSFDLKEGRLKRNKETYLKFEQTVKHTNPEYYQFKIKELQEDISWDNSVIHREEYQIEEYRKRIKEYRERLTTFYKKED